MADLSPCSPLGQVKQRTWVEAYGSNLFGQLGTDPLASGSPSVGSLSTQRFEIDNAKRIIAVCTFQTVYSTRAGEIKVVGASAHLLEELLASYDTAVASTLCFVGRDIFEAVLDPGVGTIWFLDHQEQKVTAVESKRRQRDNVGLSRGWQHIAADGRGRCLGLHTDGGAYLFESMDSLRAAAGDGEAADQLRRDRRFSAQPFPVDGAIETEQQGKAISLPRFHFVAAGDAHFALLTTDSNNGAGSQVWIFGDARYGAVPLQPLPHTTMVGRLAPASLPLSCSSPMDVPLLMPVPQFASHTHHVSVTSVAAGSRHTLVACLDQLYGWGWNGDAALLPFPENGEPGGGQHVVPEPVAINHAQPRVFTKLAAANGRSLALVDDEDTLYVAGSNEFGSLALGPDLDTLAQKPRFEREFSQIKKPYDCVNGLQPHPVFSTAGSQRAGTARKGKVIDVHATALATFVTRVDPC